MSCSVHWLHEHVNFTVNTNSGLFWVSLIPDLLCSKIFWYYSIFSYDCNAIYCIFLAKEKRDVNFVQGLLNCHSNSGTLPNGHISYQLKDSQDTTESWPTSPFLSENNDVSSVHIHKTFNTVFLTWSLSASYLLLCPSFVFPLQQDLQSSLCFTLLWRQNDTRRPRKEVQILQAQQAEKAPLPASLLSGGSQGEDNYQGL